MHMVRYGSLGFLTRGKFSPREKFLNFKRENRMNYSTLAFYWALLSIEMENFTIKIIKNALLEPNSLQTGSHVLTNCEKSARNDRLKTTVIQQE
ncbi:hypothetical protein T4A_9895 [Trichinella pseudospiralis]|uniref:Uncharacterized protein n=1 Tax=Trichinella pseudospiralis TaxID=6337 RepID=A0A0V1J8E8_TRIPS|nr:hypothetical protein T4A_9895 [Trichinella pseudospiralis]KRZ31251.1 hypothetical protein T4C_12770 [Trichinella pseudospiralis]